MPMTVGSLFAGIGGMDRGLERAGMQVVWQVEIDPYCRKVLAKHWPDVERFSDVRECGAHNLERVDLICGGFPCQPVSVAGKRQGRDDERWLWPEFHRLICELRPRWVLAENVPGLLSIDAGRLFGEILRDLAASGYDAEWDCIPAAAVGAPHRRDRVFVVADTEQPRLEKWTCFGENAREELKAAQRANCTDGGQWATEPDVGRVADRVAGRVDRLRGLGNAVVPQVAEWLGRRIMQCDRQGFATKG